MFMTARAYRFLSSWLAKHRREGRFYRRQGARSWQWWLTCCLGWLFTLLSSNKTFSDRRSTPVFLTMTGHHGGWPLHLVFEGEVAFVGADSRVCLKTVNNHLKLSVNNHACLNTWPLPHSSKRQLRNSTRPFLTFTAKKWFVLFHETPQYPEEVGKYYLRMLFHRLTVR